MKIKLSKNNSRLFKLLIIILSYSYIIFKLVSVKDLSSQFSMMKSGDFLYLITVILLLPLNWGIESLKWRFLMQPIQKVSFTDAFKAILAGVTVSIFTPNRVGEFIGRMTILKRKRRIFSIYGTIVGSISQFMVTCLIGGLAFSIVFVYGIDKNALSGFKTGSIYLTIITVIAIVTLLYFNIYGITNKIFRSKLFKKFKILRKTITFYKKSSLLKVFFMSLSRYLVFSTQYFLLLRFFNINIDFFSGYILIAVTYLLLTIIPTIAGSEAGTRGTISLLVMGEVINNDLAILSAGIGLWLINLVIPAIIGSFFFYKSKW